MQTKDRIIQAALQCYNEEGVRTVTTRTIATRLGMSAGNLHYHFKHTEDIIKALFDEMAEGYDRLLAELTNLRSYDLSIMNSVLESSFDLITKYKFIFLHFVEIASWIPSIYTAYSQLVKRQEGHLIQIFDLFIEQGVFRADIPDHVWRALARQIFIVSDFWLSNNELTDRLQGQEAADSYRSFMRAVFYPYLIK